MKAGTKSDNVWFTTKGQVVIPLWMRKEFHIEEGSRAVVVVTDGGILLHGILKRKPGGKSFTEEWAEHKNEERALEEENYARHGP